MTQNNVNRTHPPIGNLLLRTLAMPADTNPAGDIFGGWIMSQMDISGAILAREIANGRVVTAAVDGMSFLKPVSVGDVVCSCPRLAVSQGWWLHLPTFHHTFPLHSSPIRLPGESGR